MTKVDDDRFMRLALTLGRRGLGQVWPNPSVGCVIVRDGRIVGRGVTAPGGRPHAEVVALGQAGPAAEGATVYVTLEPCAHTGQTPPCAQALIEAKVARVVVACGDPDPRVNGGGLAMLTAAGIKVTTGLRADEAKADHIGFLNRVTRHRPFLTLKLAMTLDGRIATAAGESQWITAPDARRVVHAMRARHDAVLVGAGTVRTDDPQLTVRGMGDARQPVRIVVSRDLSLPVTAQLFQSTDHAPVWLCHAASADPKPFSAKGAVSVACDSDVYGMNLTSVMQTLAAKGITRIFSEGGSHLAASLLKAGLVDRLEIFQAGKVIGGNGLAAIADLGLAALSAAPEFSLVSHRQIGPDTWTSWDVAPKSTP